MAELKLSVALAVNSGSQDCRKMVVSWSLLRTLVFRDTFWGENGVLGVL